MELGLDHFLDTTDRCSLSDTVYGSAGANGWNNGKSYQFILTKLLMPNYLSVVSVVFSLEWSFRNVFIIISLSLNDSECDRFPNYTLPTLTNKEQVLCHLPSSCDRVRCCVYIAPVKRHAQVVLSMNTCSYQMEAEIDNLRITRSLFTYAWGRNYMFHLDAERWCRFQAYIYIRLKMLLFIV